MSLSLFSSHTTLNLQIIQRIVTVIEQSLSYIHCAKTFNIIWRVRHLVAVSNIIISQLCADWMFSWNSWPPTKADADHPWISRPGGLTGVKWPHMVVKGPIQV